jgi:uncharacterized phiE125 gp8 family phage protein
MMNISVVTGPVYEPISLQEAKDHLRVRHSDQDALIEALITAARQHLDGPAGTLGRCLITQTLRVTMDEWPDEIILPCPPLISVTSIEYQDGGSPTYTALTSYQVTSISEPGKIKPAYGEWWPTIQCGLYDAIRVTYTAGYGAHPGAVPLAIKQAMLLMIGDMYENAETQIIGTIVTQSKTVDALLGPYMVHSF